MKSPAEYREQAKQLRAQAGWLLIAAPERKVMLESADALDAIAQALFTGDIYTGPLPLWETARAIDLTKNPDAAPMVAVGDRMLLNLAAAQQEIAELREAYEKLEGEYGDAVLGRPDYQWKKTLLDRLDKLGIKTPENQDPEAAVDAIETAEKRHPSPQARDAERHRARRQGAWLKDKPYAHFTEEQWKAAYDANCDQVIEALADSQRELPKEKT